MTAPRRSLYFRLLRVRHLRAGPVTTFLLFEGSIALGVLLAFGDIVSPWGAVAIPVTVAIMVKLHDRVARALTAPVAMVQLYATPRLRDRPKIGRSSVTPTSRPDLDPAEPTAVGIATVPALGRAAVPDPSAWAGHHSPELRDGPRPRDADQRRPGQSGELPEAAEPAGSERDSVALPPPAVERVDAEWLRGNQGHFSV